MKKKLCVKSRYSVSTLSRDIKKKIKTVCKELNITFSIWKKKTKTALDIEDILLELTQQLK